MFRVKCLVGWLCLNVCFLIGVTYIVNMKTNQENDGKLATLEIMAIYFCGMLLYKLIFGALHILKFKLMVNCSDVYMVK